MTKVFSAYESCTAPYPRNYRGEMVTATDDEGNEYSFRLVTCHGTVEYEGNTVWLQEDAWRSEHEDADTYESRALDDEGNRYRVTWDIIDHETEDEGNTCDWNECWVEPQ